MSGRLWIAWMALACAAACSDANVAGNYTAALTNRTDGCSIGWEVGEQTSTPFTVMQSGSDVTVTVSGGGAIFLSLLLGTNTFGGGVDGEDVSADSVDVDNPPRQTSGGCQYSFTGKISASQDGDTMTGRIEYRAETNGHADCNSRTNCLSTQDFNASRPPPAE